MSDPQASPGWLRWIGRNAKRVVIFIVGVAILLAGVAMLALPGPGVLVIILGLVVLSTEFAWAERALDKAVERAGTVVTKFIDDKRGRLALGVSGVGMIIFGIVVAVFFSQFLVVGISVALAGAISLSTLHPKVGEWIEERARVGINKTDDVHD